METQKEKKPAGGAPGHKEKNTGMAVVAYILFFVPLLTDAKNDPFVKYHVRQGFTLFLAAVILAILGTIFMMYWITWVFNIVCLIFLVIGIINAVSGKEEPLPFIGKYAVHFKF
jgi:uncharacterized membrane protein